MVDGLNEDLIRNEIPDTSESVNAADVHGAGAADSLSAGSAERQCRIDLVLDLDQRVQDHRTNCVQVQSILLVKDMSFNYIRYPLLLH